MKQRQRRKQFWWAWHSNLDALYSRTYGWFDWGMARTKHQQKGRMK
jgi:hypothetical protein